MFVKLVASNRARKDFVQTVKQRLFAADGVGEDLAAAARHGEVSVLENDDLWDTARLGSDVGLEAHADPRLHQLVVGARGPQRLVVLIGEGDTHQLAHERGEEMQATGQA